MGTSKGVGEGQKGVEYLAQGDPSTGKKAPIWMATGRGGFINMNGHRDRRIVKLGPKDELVDK